MQTDRKILRRYVSKFAGEKLKQSQTYDNLRKRGPLSNESHERMRHTLPSCKLMEDRTSGNPDKLSPVLILIVGGSVTCVVVVLFLDGHRVLELIGIGSYGEWMAVRWNCDHAFLACDDEVTKVSPIYTVEAVFLSLIKK